MDAGRPSRDVDRAEQRSGFRKRCRRVCGGMSAERTSVTIEDAGPKQVHRNNRRRESECTFRRPCPPTSPKAKRLRAFPMNVPDHAGGARDSTTCEEPAAASRASDGSWVAVVCGRCAAGRPSASRRSVILPRGRGGGKHFFRVPRPAVPSERAIAVTTRFRARSRTFISFPSPLP